MLEIAFGIVFGFFGIAIGLFLILGIAALVNYVRDLF